MNRIIYPYLFFLFSISAAIGQELSICEEAEKGFGRLNGVCINKISSNNCVNLDITDSYDFEGKEFTFLWDMGDGTTLEGLNIDHCYTTPGAYVAKLSLKDPITKVIIREEASIDIVIKGSFELTMNSLEDVRTDIEELSTFNLDYPDSAYQVDYTYWDFGDGQFSCDENPTHSYSKTGTYHRSLLVKLTSSLDSVVLCATDSIVVKLSDPTAGLLIAAINNLPTDSRFLEDKPRYRLLKSNNGLYKEAESMNDLIGSKSLRVIAFRGNLIFDSQEINVESNDLKAIQSKISERTIQVAETQPVKLEPIFFELDQDELSRKIKKTLKDNAEVIQNLPMLKVGIGVFTTSGGSYNKSLALSIERANIIKDFLIESGVEERRIVIFNPNTARTLINTCISGNCDYVDGTLDRRADFKFLEE